LDNNDAEQTQATGIPLDGLLMAYISNLYKYVKHYAKKILENTPLVGLDDFVFLLSVRYNPNCSKTELIQKHLLEVSSGMEILKRLHKENLVKEIPSEMDKRKKILRLTPEGEALVEQLLPTMGQLASLTSADLSLADKVRLLHSLKYLDDFHQNIFQQKSFKSLSFEEIIREP
jgi:DNA-binding MarR family transcriptional regulator